jgi:nitric oxide synthase-interacting protein
LNSSPIDAGDAVATPSGHIYSREAIVSYLLTKNGELKKQKAEWERKRLEVENRRVEWEEKQRKKQQDKFVKKDQGAMSTALVLRDDDDASGRGVAVGRSSVAAAAAKPSENSLKHVSYWLATSQPQHTKGGAKYDGDFDYAKEIEALPPAPPERPPSPMSGEPLKLKQLIPLQLVREGAEDSTKAKSKESTGKILCAVSHKTITTQPTIVIKNTGQVMLKSVYKELAQPTMTCPITGKKFKEKDVLELIKGKSGFAASGEVIAKKYQPTLT